jgi:hypothetical protein
MQCNPLSTGHQEVSGWTYPVVKAGGHERREKEVGKEERAGQAVTRAM